MGGQLNGWTQVNQQCCRRIIGFYFTSDSLYERIHADAYIKFEGNPKKNDANQGAYCHLDPNNKTIRLSREMPQAIREKIVPNETVIRNHMGGEMNCAEHMYPFFKSARQGTQRVVADNEWHQSQHCIHGSSSVFELSHDRFRLGTKFIKLGIICNKQGSLWFNNLKIEQM